MSIFPTATARHVALAALGIAALGVVLERAQVVAWGGSMIVVLALARTVTLVSVMRIRAAGFEMMWTTPVRAVRTGRGHGLVVAAEVRNRDTLAARFERLRVVASPALDVEVQPSAGDVPASGALAVEIHIAAKRVGYHGVYGLALEVRGAPGLFEIPLTFANPLGVEVLPRGLARSLALPQGGRSGTTAASGRAGRRRGDGTELRELREHRPGDPFRRIAWKASARRGILVVREFEREERDVVALVLDASVELWAGPIGEAPLDYAIDLVSSLAARHLQNGDRVGLSVVGARELGHVPPDVGREQASRIATVLMDRTGVLDADRCGWDEADLLAQVVEHLRPLEPRVTADLRVQQLDRVMKRVQALGAHAPFRRSAPYGRSARDRRLRSYAAGFGLFVPPRLQPDRPRSAAALSAAMLRVAHDSRIVPSVVHVVAPPPTDDEAEPIRTAVARLRRRRIALRWTTPPFGAPGAAPRPGATGTDGAGTAAEQAVLTRALVAQRHGQQTLRRMGVKLVSLARGGQPPAEGGDAAEAAPQPAVAPHTIAHRAAPWATPSRGGP